VHLLHGLSLVSWICCHSAGIEVGHAKVEAIHGWPIPKNLSQVQSFLRLAGFYRHFVNDFSTIAASSNELTKKGVPFSWGTRQPLTC
jgi:hypothetical protein